ncbi:MAG: hypothetical protein QXK74_06160 [Candidatus Nitrosocaldaceae archaeon]
MKRERIKELLTNLRRKIIVTIPIDKEALDRTKKLGIDAIYDNIIYD